ncbi:MAG: hypothetical protein RLZZ200_40 [Pseudomonadota bacterium]|jgi:formate dehydrogenase subunit delta
MNIEHLVTMANDIGNFFVSEAGDDAAPREIATHITKFWDPRMRTAIIGHGKAGGEGLSPASKAAVALLVPPPPRD